MKRVIGGFAVGVLFLIPHWTASAQSPAAADLWVGIENSKSGFLLDTATGSTWMTGSCLKPVAQAQRVGTTWVSETREMVSVGRMDALLEQTFQLDVTPDAPSIMVDNPARGGAQRFDDVVLLNCQDGACRDLVSTPAC